MYKQIKQCSCSDRTGAVFAETIIKCTINDLIEIDTNYGRVEKITLHTTCIITVDGKMLAVPNAIIINKTVTYHANFPRLRLHIAVAESIDNRARSVLLSGLVRTIRIA